MKYIVQAVILLLITKLCIAQTTYQYDSLNRLTQVTYPNGASFTYTYDANGNRISKVSTQGINLPIEMLSFHGKVLNNANELSWTLSSESTEGFFEIERLSPQNQYEVIGKVQRADGGSQSRSYEFLDTDPFQGRNLYRLRIIELDGSISYSHWIELIREKSVLVQVYPNPTEGLLFFKINSQSESFQRLEIYSLQGQRVLLKDLRKRRENDIQVDISDFSQSVYLYRIFGQNDVWEGVIELK
jgi:YD repeat-containing protein